MNNRFSINSIFITFLMITALAFSIFAVNKLQNINKKEIIYSNSNECFNIGHNAFKAKYINTRNTCNSFDTSCNEEFYLKKNINISIYNECKGE